ncbi:FtsX-like permease family protein [Halobacillus sp. GSS1]|uniref:ABC transporter permease n=1 Tax=Halobacillus sp. GSS1 TaxID=2815919 RepID=UPI001A8F06F6|nr:FtsX-like permease family protein [Halobacillus sp. GSS1]MBN9653417.1 FtsX-like permease family protein [Halobacillus sp. GSS1]
MIRFIWNSWWRNKERFILLLIGALIVSIGLSYLVGTTQASQGTIVDELQKRWKSSYDIVVRAPGSRSVTEDKQLLEPNYLSGLNGGISLEQYETIRSMEKIETAAPISMMGYVDYGTTLAEVNYDEPGIYRLHMSNSTTNGVSTYEDDNTLYFTVGDWQAPQGTQREYGVTGFNGKLINSNNILIAGIDPQAEARLTGLNDAISDETEQSGSFLDNEASVSIKEVGTGIQNINIPVLLSNQSFVEGTSTYTIEKLEQSFKQDEQEEVMNEVKERGGVQYLDDLEAKQVDHFNFTSEESHQKTIELIKGTNEDAGASLDSFNWMAFHPSPVNYQEVNSPFGERWPFAYQVEPHSVPEDSPLAQKHAYRPITMFSETSEGWPRLELDFHGVFDPSQLDLSKDPLNELPMETYFPSSAKWVMDNEENPINPPKEMKPLNNPYGFLTKPPLLLTTIEAASQVLGEEPISAIRVKVRGVDEMSESSGQVLEQIAKDIEEETGLITDITLGSSPQPAITHIPASGEQESLGWVEQPWIKLSSSISIFKESKMGLSGVIASVIVVAIVYVFASNIMMMYARKKEFAVLLAVGWRPKQLSLLIFIEALILGIFVSLVSWLILGIIYVTNDIETSIWRLLFIAIFGLSVYLLGSLVPSILVQRISPYETMKTGEVTTKKRHSFQAFTSFGMAANQFMTQWKRALLSVVSIALPTAMLMYFLFVTVQLRGTMYTTWLGEFVAMEVGVMHYIAMGVALLIAILTTAEIMWQNVSERQAEFSVLKALGWRNHTVRMLVLWEGAIFGLIAGLLGLSLSLVAITISYNKFPFDSLLFFSSTLLIPIVTGIVGAMLPAMKAVQLTPSEGFRGGVSNTAKTEKAFRYVFSTGGAALAAGVVAIMLFAIPANSNSNEQVDSSSTSTNDIEGTEGELEVSSPTEEEIKVEDDGTDQTGDSIMQEKKNAYKTLILGDEVFDAEDKEVTVERVDPPSSLKTNEKLITIRTSYHRKAGEGSVVYKPQTFQLMSSDGESYKPIEFEEVTTDSTWNGFEIKGQSKVVTESTFEVSESSEKLAFKMNGSWTPGEIIIEFES